METIKLLNQKVSIFDNAAHSKVTKYDDTLINFLQKTQLKERNKIMYCRKINKVDQKKGKKYKEDNIACATVSATFDKYRYNLNAKEKTGIIAIDIDKDKNPFLDVDKAKRDVMQLPYVFLSMLSCRGEGVWCAVYYNKDKFIGYVHNALKEDFRKIGYTIDDTKDLARLRVASWDDHILIKNNVEMYNREIIPEERDEKEYVDWVLTKDDLRDITIIIYVLTHFFNYSVDDYYDWLYEGFRLATIPNKELGLKLFQMISENSDNYEGPADVEAKFNECRNTTHNKTNVLGYYINKIKEIYGDDWRYRINELLKGKIIV